MSFLLKYMMVVNLFRSYTTLHAGLLGEMSYILRYALSARASLMPSQ